MDENYKSDEQLLAEYRDLWVEFGHPPDRTELEAAAGRKKCSPIEVFAQRFGIMDLIRIKVVELYGDPLAPDPEDLPLSVAPEPEPDLEPANPPTPTEPTEITDPAEPTPEDTLNRFINWLPWPIRFANGQNKSEVIYPNTKERLFLRSALDGYFTSESIFELCDQFGAIPSRIFTEELRLHIQDEQGNQQEFPLPADGVFHVVSRDVILAAIISGRPVYDLFYPLYGGEAPQSDDTPREVCELRAIDTTPNDT